MKTASIIKQQSYISALLVLLALLAAIVLHTGCNGGNKTEGEAAKTAEAPSTEKTIPHYMKIKHVDVGANIDAAMVNAGKEVFEMKCTACHKMDERYVGPALGDVAKRRTPEYIMNMILDTETMIENDDTVKCLLQTFLMKMPNQSVDEKDARNVLEHLRGYAETKK